MIPGAPSGTIGTTMQQLRNRWLALIVLCMATLMIVLDTTIVNVALPSIKASLGFTDTDLAWVVNAYALTYAGFLLLGGRLGDLYGQRRLFLLGVVLFTASSLLCGLASSQAMLIIARAMQGIGGAVASAISLSLVMNMFPEPDDRARAMGIFGFVAAGGGSVGAILGGVLTGILNWHWIFLVNIPIGIAVVWYSLRLLSAEHAPSKHTHLDIWGALSITASLMIAVYAIVNGSIAGWHSAQTMGLLAISIALLIAFAYVESAVRSPLMPMSILSLRSVAGSNAVAILWSASMFSWFFLSALYMQQVLGYAPLLIGLAFIPANLIMAVFSIWLSAKSIARFGIKNSLVSGLSLSAAGLLLFAHAPVGGSFLIDIMPPMILMGLGGGSTFNPLLLAAMNDVPGDESGLASGIVNTSFMMGGALGLAILASLANSRTQTLLSAGADMAHALTGGYDRAFLVGGAFAAAAALLAIFALKTRARGAGQLRH